MRTYSDLYLSKYNDVQADTNKGYEVTMAKFTGFFEATRQYREKYEKAAIENTQRRLLAFLAMKSGEVKLGKGKVISGEKSQRGT